MAGTEFEQLRERAWQERRAGRYAQAAELERQAAEWAETAGQPGLQVQAWLWEGYCLRQAGDSDTALAILMQAVNSVAAEIDPADSYSALTTVIAIALNRKPAAFCRRLLAQGREYLDNLGRPQWRPMLDFLEGELEYTRGDFAAAWTHYQRAWENRQDSYPCFTAVTHLWALCRTAFRRCDPAALQQVVASMEAQEDLQVLEKLLIERARLLLWRACRHLEMELVVELALDTLNTAGLIQLEDKGAVRDGLRVLALTERWQLLDEASSRYPLGNGFEDWLCLGDLALGRMRAASGLPAQDTEYGGEPPALLETQKKMPATALEPWRRVEHCYRTAQPLAVAEDRRLETGWHQEILAQRLKMGIIE